MFAGYYLFFILIALLVYFTLLLLVSTELPYSPVYNYEPNDIHLVERVLEKNRQRYAGYKNFLQSYNVSKKLFRFTEKQNTYNYLSIGIVTTERLVEGESWDFGFLLQTVASILMETRNVDEVTTVICNADRPPTKHKTATELSSFVPVFDLWDVPGATDNFDPTTDSYAKETDDYILCLETVRKKFKSKYVLIAEDDVVMKVGSLKTLKYFISNLETRHTDDLLFLKLYYPKKWLGYSKELRTILELISSSVLISSIIMIITNIIKKLRTRSIIILQIFFSLILLPTFLILGRQTSVKWREISSSFHTLFLTPGCCTQAMLYNSKHITKLIKFLKNSRINNKNPIDLLIDEYVKSGNYNGYLIEPSLFEHIGFWSSFSNNKKDAIDFL